MNDYRGTPASSQIVWLELENERLRLQVEELDQECARLSNLLTYVTCEMAGETDAKSREIYYIKKMFKDAEEALGDRYLLNATEGGRVSLAEGILRLHAELDETRKRFALDEITPEEASDGGK